jgi:cytochrome c oxidase subunit 2
MKHIAIASVLVLGVTALLLLGLRLVPLLPGPPASTQGVLVDRLFHWEVYVIAFIFSLVVVFILYAVIAFRRRPGDTADGPHVKSNTPLEIAWTVIPLIVVVAFALVSGRDLKAMLQPHPNEMEVEVTGFQYGWKFHYPDSGVTSSTLYLPRGQPIAFKLTSLDVIHDFWVPEWRIKQDAVPGQWHTLRITPTEVGDYIVRCNEMCGYAHAQMLAPVVVVEPDEFQAWVAQQQADAGQAGEKSPAEAGKALVDQQGCLGCHSVDGADHHGPTFKGLYGAEVKLEDGSTVVAGDTYLAESIRDPMAHIVAGFELEMPAAYTDLTDQQVQAIVEYIRSLK